MFFFFIFLTNKRTQNKKGGDYAAPTLERSPEVYHTLSRLDATGCDVFVDVHGDETLPYNFISGMEGLPNWGPRLQVLRPHTLVAEGLIH